MRNRQKTGNSRTIRRLLSLVTVLAIVMTGLAGIRPQQAYAASHADEAAAYEALEVGQTGAQVTSEAPDGTSASAQTMSEAPAVPDPVINWAPGSDDSTLERAGTYVDQDGISRTVIFTRWDSTDSLPATAGAFYLAADVTIGSTWSLTSGTTELCLNGHSIMSTATSATVSVTGCEFILFDVIGDQGTITHDAGSRTTSSSIGVEVSNALFTLNGGTITENYLGVNAFDNSTFTMNGGAISGNVGTASRHDSYGLERSSGSVLIMTGGSIDDYFSNSSGYSTVWFSPGEGSGTDAVQYIRHNTLLPLRPNDFTAPAGKEFAGWKSLITSLRFSDRQKITLTGYYLVLEAQWVPIGSHVPSQPSRVDLNKKLSKYTEYKEEAQSFLDNINALYNAVSYYGDEDGMNSVYRRKQQMESYLSIADDAIAAITSYYSGASETLELFSDIDEALLNLNLGTYYGDPSGSARDRDIVYDSCMFAIGNTLSAVKNDDNEAARQAILYYLDAEETLWKYFEAGGLSGAKSLFEDYESYKDPSVYSSHTEDWLYDTAINIYVMLEYYEWMLYTLMFDDYTEYLQTSGTGTSDSLRIIEQTFSIMYESIEQARKIVYEELLPRFFLTPNRNLVYDGTEQALLTESDVFAGTAEYAFGVPRRWEMEEGNRDYDIIDVFDFLPRDPELYGDWNGTLPADSVYSSDIPIGTDAGTYYVYFRSPLISFYNNTYINYLKITIDKADPEYTVPTGLKADPGQTLADVVLPAGWAWNDATLSVGSAGTKTFKASFTPQDPANYNVIEDVNIRVRVGRSSRRDDSDGTAAVETVQDPDLVENPDGTFTKTTVNEEDGKTVTLKVTTDKDGNVLMTETETVSTDENGTLTVNTVIERADGSYTERTEKTWTSGKTFIETIDIVGDKKTTTSETVYPSGRTVSKYITEDSEGKTSITKKTYPSGRTYTETITETTGKRTEIRETVTPDGVKTVVTAVTNEKGNTNFKKSVTDAEGNSVTMRYSVKPTADGYKVTFKSRSGRDENIVIPGHIKFGGTKYRINALAKNAFNKFAKTITLPRFITSVAKGAFARVSPDAVIDIHGGRRAVKRITNLIKASGINSAIRMTSGLE